MLLRVQAGVSVELLRQEVASCLDTEASAHINPLQAKFVKDQHKELEHDLMVLKDTYDITTCCAAASLGAC